MSNNGALHLTDANFTETIKEAGKPVMVDFYAEWCGPCQVAGPIIDELAQSQNKVLVTKVNIDENPKTARKYDVMSIPTVMIFKYEAGDVKEVAKQVGFPGKEGYQNMIDGV